MEIVDAELVAARLMGWLAQNPSHMLCFCETTGIVPIDLLVRGDSPDVLGGLLDFILNDDMRLQEFCRTCDIAPDLPARARQSLPGMMPDC